MRFYQLSENTEDQVKSFAKYIEQKYPARFFLSYSPTSDYITLGSIVVQDKKQGIGTQIMNELTDFADKIQQTIYLNPAQKNDFHGTTSRGRLIKFYKRFGFVENKGRNKDFRFSPGMIRRPQ